MANTTIPQDIFQRGCLIQLSMKKWSGVKHIPKEVVQEMSKSEWVRANKNLIDPESLQPIKAIVSKVNQYIKNHSLPFPIDSFHMIPKESTSIVDEELTKIQTEFYRLVEEFLIKYPQLREDAKNTLPENLFDPLDYPLNIEDVRKRFYFGWRYTILNVPTNNGVQILDPYIYEREKQKFIQDMKDTRKGWVDLLTSEMIGLIDHLTDRLTPKPDGSAKVFKEESITNFKKYFEKFKELTAVFEDREIKDLKDTVEKCELMFSKIGFQELQSAPMFRDFVKSKFEVMKGNIDTSLTNRTKRKLTI